MLNQPMMEKLLAMRLQGMVEALKTQEQDRAINELSFLERLALLVDQQWTWRENQALARRLKAAKLRGPGCVEDIDYRQREAWTRRWCVLWQKTRPGSATTRTFSCWVRPAWARASSHPPWHRKLVAMATRHSICGLPPCFVNWPWHEPTEACATSWHDWAFRGAQLTSLICWRPRRDLNPCYRRERALAYCKQRNLQGSGRSCMYRKSLLRTLGHRYSLYRPCTARIPNQRRAQSCPASERIGSLWHPLACSLRELSAADFP